jgi:hypothetical protein
MEENLELEQDIDEAFADIEDVEDAEEVEETSEDAEDVELTDDEELEYDEDGNVVEAEKEPANDTDTQVEEREEKTDTTPEATPPTFDNALNDKQTEREAILIDALKALGIEHTDLDQALLQLAADAKGVSVEKYTKDRTEARQAEEAQRVYRQVMMEQMISRDMNELHALFPETKSISKFENLPNVKRYAELRDKGLSVKEAYSAANPDGRRDAIVNSVKQQTINASKSHLKSNVPIASKDTSVKITRAEMELMRDLFPDKSDKELVALYKKTK